jgi:hypothetical protein
MMKEALFAGVVLAITLNWISRSARKPDGFVRHFSRGAFMRDLNEKMEAQLSNPAS